MGTTCEWRGRAKNLLGAVKAYGCTAPPTSGKRLGDSSGGFFALYGCAKKPSAFLGARRVFRGVTKPFWSAGWATMQPFAFTDAIFGPSPPRHQRASSRAGPFCKEGYCATERRPEREGGTGWPARQWRKARTEPKAHRHTTCFFSRRLQPL